MLIGSEQIVDGFSLGNLVLQGGSFGLLIYIVVRLGPTLMKEGRSERESRDDKFERMVKDLQAGFEERNRNLVAAITSQTDKLVTEERRGIDEITQVLVNSCNYPEGGPQKRPRPPQRQEYGK